MIVLWQMDVDSIAFAVPTTLKPSISVCYEVVFKNKAFMSGFYWREMHRTGGQMLKN
jgi:hypothetical protein